MGKKLLAFVGIVIALVAAWTALTLVWAYSSGERAGYVQKFSKKGWVCKTWEGEMAMVTMPGNRRGEVLLHGEKRRRRREDQRDRRQPRRAHLRRAQVDPVLVLRRHRAFRDGREADGGVADARGVPLAQRPAPAQYAQSVISIGDSRPLSVGDARAAATQAS